MAATERRLIDHVVVQQSRCVNHLDDCGKFVMIAASIAAGLRREEQQRGAKSFSASADDVLGNLADQDDFGVKRLAQYGVDFTQVVAQHRLKQGDCYGRRRIGHK